MILVSEAGKTWEVPKKKKLQAASLFKLTIKPYWASFGNI